MIKKNVMFMLMVVFSLSIVSAPSAETPNPFTHKYGTRYDSQATHTAPSEATDVDVVNIGGQLYQYKSSSTSEIVILSDITTSVATDSMTATDAIIGTMSASGDFDVNADIVGDGGGTFSGMLKVVDAHAAGSMDTVTIDESEYVHTNTGETGAHVINLPEASTAVGMQFTFVVAEGENLDINPDDADLILGLTNAVGDAIRSNTSGDTCTLNVIDDTNWVQTGGRGTWSDVN